MKAGIRSLIIVIASTVLLCHHASAVIIDQWTFPNTAGTATSPIGADVHNNSTANLTWTPPTGSTLTAAYGLIGGNGAFQLSYAGNHPSYLNGTTITLAITASGANLSGLVLSYDSMFNAAGASVTWSYSINGGSSTSIGTYSAGNGTLVNSGNINLGFNLNNGQTVTFIGTINGASGNNGTLSFDNINFIANSVSPVPEATNYALAAFGLVVVGAGAGRFCFRSRPSAS